MIGFSLDYALNLIITFALCFARIGAAFVIFPLVSGKMIPNKIKLIFALAITIYCTPLFLHKNSDMQLIILLLRLMLQFVVGFIIGYLVYVSFQVFIYFGELMAMQSGLGFATLNDPVTNSNVPIVGQFYMILISLLFVSFDGHLMLIKLITDSFSLFPISINSLDGVNLTKIFSVISWLFISALKVSLPGVAAIFIFNISLGFITKVAPQLNLFSIGFPITMLLGLVVGYFCMNKTFEHFDDRVNEVSNGVYDVLDVKNE